jgi:putative NADH-flavin reductase
MKVVVLGATGATGRLIVGKAVAKGHEVVALFAPEKRPQTSLAQNSSKATRAIPSR